jgi:hypothetical protein
VAEIEVFVRGNKIITRATWKTESVPASGNYDTLTDPTTVVFSARSRGAAKTDYTYPASPEATKVSTGIYELTLTPAVGRWWVHAQGTGTAYGSGRVTFEIDESEALAA